MPDEPEEGFTVRDRRRFHAEDEVDTVPTVPAQEAAIPDPGTSGSILDPTEDDLSYPEEEYADSGALPDIYSVLALFLGELRNLAWMRMGLIANPSTNQIERDLSQAKIAIDTVAFLAGKLEPVVAPEERLPLKAMVSDLQANFVEQSKR